MTASPPRRKPHRHTAERIAQAALALFNRFGEPNVSMQTVAHAVGISEGNLYYHFRTKDALVDQLVLAHLAAHDELLPPLEQATSSTEAVRALHALAALGWAHRFLLRDTTALVTRHHLVQTRLRTAWQARDAALNACLARTHAAEATADRACRARAITLELAHWVSQAFVADPHHALDDDRGDTHLAAVRAQLEWLLAAPAVRP